MGKASRNMSRRNRSSGLVPRILKWTVGLGIVALIVYGLSQSSGVAYSDKDIAVVDFSGLTSDEKRTALQEANRARCPCGCGMTLAQCVSTDSTCPIRDTNVQKIRTMVRAADAP
jgi:hypothetical protein